MLLPLVEPAWTGALMLVMVPPQMVRRRGAPEYASAPFTDRPLVVKPSDGKALLDGLGRDGHMDDTPPPPAPQILPLALVTSHVARKS